jgi:peptide/nickel transport system permease protein
VGAQRLLIVTIASLLVAVAAVVVGGVSLLAGLTATALLAVAVLPRGPRRYLLRRLFRVVWSLLVAMALIWMLVHNYPDASRQDQAGPVAAMQHYVSWLGAIVAGDLGGTTSYSETVGRGVGRSLPISLQLLTYSQILAVAMAVPAALVGARFRGRLPDVGFRAAGMFGLALPLFISGTLLMQVFGVGRIGLFGMTFGIKLLPTGRYVPLGSGLVPHVRSMAIPSITLAVSSAATYLVLLRSEVLQQLTLDHVQLAKAKGLSPGRIVRRHALRPAAPTVVAAIAAQSGLILGNVVIVEYLFLLPGFGDYVIVAIGRRDEAAVVGALFVAAVILGAVNLMADALLLVIDPRLET